MAERTAEDRLREEYSRLLPGIRQLTQELEAEIRYHTLDVARSLDRHERLIVTSRIKDCESAVDALRRRQEGGTFDTDNSEAYTLSDLPDLAGVRILVFPPSRLPAVDQALRAHFYAWTPDPVFGESGEMLALKYHGYRGDNTKIPGEYQIVSLLTGLFWEAEHSAIYKPTPRLKGVAHDLMVRQSVDKVLKALRAFEEEFESSVRRSMEP